MSVTHHIGLEIAERSLRLVEMRSTDGFLTILRTDVRETAKDYSSLLYTAAHEAAAAQEFAREMKDFIHARQVLSTSVSLVLATHTPLIATIPADPTLTFEEKRRHFEWECRTLFGLDPGVKLSVQSVPLVRANHAETWLVTAMPAAVVSLLRTMFAQMTFDIRTIDITHFAVENGIHSFHPGSEMGTCAILGLERGRCHAGLNHEQTYLGYRSGEISHHAPYLRQALTVLHDLLEQESGRTLGSVYIYGPEAAHDVASEMQDLLSIPVRRFDPLNRFSFLAGSDAEIAQHQPPSSLDAALCVTWKGLQP